MGCTELKIDVESTFKLAGALSLCITKNPAELTYVKYLTFNIIYFNRIANCEFRGRIRVTNCRFKNPPTVYRFPASLAQPIILDTVGCIRLCHIAFYVSLGKKGLFSIGFGGL
jgi:hypothetical protein